MGSSAEKRHRQSLRRRARNRWRMRTLAAAIRDFNALLASGSRDDAVKSFRACCRIIDRTAQKGVIHRNQAARRKSRLSARLRARTA